MSEPAVAEEEERRKRTEFLFAESEKFCEKIGLPKDFIIKVYQSDDWAFCVQSASLIESVLNELLHRGLKFELGKGKFFDKADFSSFVERLPMLGRIGRKELARICGAATDDLNFIEALFLLRNAYSHDIRNANTSLFDMVTDHPEKQKLLRGFNILANDESAEKFAAAIAQDHGILKFAILDWMQRFIALANLINARR
jgi:hypothetical protein